MHMWSMSLSLWYSQNRCGSIFPAGTIEGVRSLWEIALFPYLLNDMIQEELREVSSLCWWLLPWCLFGRLYFLPYSFPFWLEESLAFKEAGLHLPKEILRWVWRTPLSSTVDTMSREVFYVLSISLLNYFKKFGESRHVITQCLGEMSWIYVFLLIKNC